jgi:hypothetical protein
VEDFPVPGGGGRVGEDGRGELAGQLVDEEGLGSVDEEEAGDPASGEIAKESRGLQPRFLRSSKS